MVGLTDNEAMVFIELRRIKMKCGSVHLNYDDKGEIKSIDEYRHTDLSTGNSLQKRKKSGSVKIS